MKNRSPIVVAWLVTAVIAGCGQTPPDDVRPAPGVTAGPLDFATNDKQIVAFGSWLKRKGVTLEYMKVTEDYGVWKIIQPKTSDEYEVTFHIRSFPSGASEVQMREAIDVNLTYMLNAPAHLAMSHAIVSGTHADAKVPQSDDALPKISGVPITKLVEQLFNEYKPG